MIEFSEQSILGAKRSCKFVRRLNDLLLDALEDLAELLDMVSGKRVLDLKKFKKVRQIVSMVSGVVNGIHRKLIYSESKIFHDLARLDLIRKKLNVMKKMKKNNFFEYITWKKNNKKIIENSG